MPKSPFALVKEQFKDKAGLIDAVKALSTDDLWIDRLNDDKGLPRVSNKKLLHLHQVLSQVKQEHGSRAKLIEAILEGSKRSKDADYRAGLEKKSTVALFALAQSQKKRIAAAAPKPKPAKPKPAAEAKAPASRAAKKPVAKKSAAQKPAAKKAAAKKKKKK